MTSLAERPRATISATSKVGIQGRNQGAWQTGSFRAPGRQQVQGNAGMLAEGWQGRAPGVGDHVDLDAAVGQRERVILHTWTAAEIAEHHHRHSLVVLRNHPIFAAQLSRSGIDNRPGLR
jgi:hypothetical protein